MQDLVQDKFIEQQLSVYLRGMPDIGLEVNSNRRLVRASVLLLCRDEEDNGIQIGEIIVIGTAENDILIKTHIEPGSGIYVEMMNNRIFFGVLIIRVGIVLTDQFHINGLVVELPDPGIEFQKEIGSAVVAEEKASIAISDKVLIITKLDVEVFKGVEINGCPVIEIVITGSFEVFVVSGARHGIEFCNTLLKPGRAPFLVVGKIGRETQLAGYHPPESKPL